MNPSFSVSLRPQNEPEVTIFLTGLALLAVAQELELDCESLARRLRKLIESVQTEDPKLRALYRTHGAILLALLGERLT